MYSRFKKKVNHTKSPLSSQAPEEHDVYLKGVFCLWTRSYVNTKKVSVSMCVICSLSKRNQSMRSARPLPPGFGRSRQ